MTTKTKTDALALLMIGLMMLLLCLILAPLAKMIMLVLGSVLAGTGGSLYYREFRREREYRENSLKYGNPA